MSDYAYLLYSALLCVPFSVCSYFFSGFSLCVLPLSFLLIRKYRHLLFGEEAA